LPPGAGADITNCGSGSFLFFHRLEANFIEEIMAAEEVFENYTNLNLILGIIKQYGAGARAGAGAGAGIWICGSVEPEPKEIFSAPQHCKNFCHLLSTT
jgi:hypothetical protein